MAFDPGSVRIVEDRRYRANLEELAWDFPRMDAVRDAIRWGLTLEPWDGHQIETSPEVFVSTITSPDGAPTFRYMWRFERRAEGHAVVIFSIDRVLPQSPPPTPGGV